MSVPFKFSSVFAGELKFRMRTSPWCPEHGYCSITQLAHVVRQLAPGTVFLSSLASAQPLCCRHVSDLADRGVATVSTSPCA
jgi:hypothetical protein